MDDNSDPNILEVTIDPDETSLTEILEIAENHRDECITITGEVDGQDVQWGVVAVCGKGAGEMLHALQKAVDTILERRKKQTLN